MLTCDKTYSATLEEKKSKFIAFISPYNNFSELLATLKEEHPKARHLVTAFRYLNELEQIVEGSSDDKEPRGTAGKPILHVLQGHNLINVAVVVVRYFGGIKLGTGGLVRAYSDAVNLAFDECKLIKYEKQEDFSFSCSYSDLGKAEYNLQLLGITKVEKEFKTLEVKVSVQATVEQIDKFKTSVMSKIKVGM